MEKIEDEIVDQNNSEGKGAPSLEENPGIQSDSPVTITTIFTPRPGGNNEASINEDNFIPVSPEEEHINDQEYKQFNHGIKLFVTKKVDKQDKKAMEDQNDFEKSLQAIAYLFIYPLEESDQNTFDEIFQNDSKNLKNKLFELFKWINRDTDLKERLLKCEDYNKLLLSKDLERRKAVQFFIPIFVSECLTCIGSNEIISVSRLFNKEVGGKNPAFDFEKFLVSPVIKKRVRSSLSNIENSKNITDINKLFIKEIHECFNLIIEDFKFIFDEKDFSDKEFIQYIDIVSTVVSSLESLEERFTYEWFYIFNILINRINNIVEALKEGDGLLEKTKKSFNNDENLNRESLTRKSLSEELVFRHSLINSHINLDYKNIYHFFDSSSQCEIIADFAEKIKNTLPIINYKYSNYIRIYYNRFILLFKKCKDKSLYEKCELSFFIEYFESLILANENFDEYIDLVSFKEISFSSDEWFIRKFLLFIIEPMNRMFFGQFIPKNFFKKLIQSDLDLSFILKVLFHISQLRIDNAPSLFEDFTKINPRFKNTNISIEVYKKIILLENELNNNKGIQASFVIFLRDLGYKINESIKNIQHEIKKYNLFVKSIEDIKDINPLFKKYSYINENTSIKNVIKMINRMYSDRLFITRFKQFYGKDNSTSEVSTKKDKAIFEQQLEDWINYCLETNQPFDFSLISVLPENFSSFKDEREKRAEYIKKLFSENPGLNKIYHEISFESKKEEMLCALYGKLLYHTYKSDMKNFNHYACLIQESVENIRNIVIPYLHDVKTHENQTDEASLTNEEYSKNKENPTDEASSTNKESLTNQESFFINNINLSLVAEKLKKFKTCGKKYCSCFFSDSIPDGIKKIIEKIESTNILINNSDDMSNIKDHLNALLFSIKEIAKDKVKNNSFYRLGGTEALYQFIDKELFPDLEKSKEMGKEEKHSSFSYEGNGIAAKLNFLNSKINEILDNDKNNHLLASYLIRGSQ